MSFSATCTHLVHLLQVLTSGSVVTPRSIRNKTSQIRTIPMSKLPTTHQNCSKTKAKNLSRSSSTLRENSPYREGSWVGFSPSCAPRWQTMRSNRVVDVLELFFLFLFFWEVRGELRGRILYVSLNVFIMCFSASRKISPGDMYVPNLL